jgi:hypothetical protein
LFSLTLTCFWLLVSVLFNVCLIIVDTSCEAYWEVFDLCSGTCRSRILRIKSAGHSSTPSAKQILYNVFRGLIVGYIILEWTAISTKAGNHTMQVLWEALGAQIYIVVLWLDASVLKMHAVETGKAPKANASLLIAQWHLSTPALLPPPHRYPLNHVPLLTTF